MADPTPQDPTTDPTEPVAAVDDTRAPAASTSAATPSSRRFLNRTTGALVAVGLVGALIGGGAVAVAGRIGDGGGGRHEGWEHHNDADRGPQGMHDGPWGQRDGRSFGPGGGMGRGGQQGGDWGGGQQMPQGGQQQGGQPQGGQQQGGQPQFGPQGGSMPGGAQGGWGPQGMTRGS